MKYKIIKWLGLVFILEAGFLHYAASQSAYLKAPYLGFLLVGIFLATLIAAFGIYHKQAWGWGIGAMLSIGSLIGYAWNSTFGLPQLAVGPWLYPYAIVASIAETLFLGLVLFRPWKLSEMPVVSSSHYGLFLPSIVIMVAAMAFPTYKWDIYASEVGYHRHVASVEVVCSTPVTSQAELEERYGIQLSLVGMTMLDGVVDVRLKILDPEKADQLLRDQVALLVDQQYLVLAPHAHQHFMLKRNKIHTLFFPTVNKKIHSGSEVSLVFGPVRTESVVVK